MASISSSKLSKSRRKSSLVASTGLLRQSSNTSMKGKNANNHSVLIQPTIKEISDRPCLAYTVLTESQTNTLMDIQCPDELESTLCEFLSVTGIDVDLKQSALLDYYVLTVDWAKKQSFTCQQISAFFTLCHTLLENVKEKQLSRVENMKELKKMLAGIGVENLEITGGLDFFTPDQAHDIIKYLSKSFFQHYPLYQVVFTQPRQEHIQGIELELDVPKAADIPWPSPLNESISESVYLKYIASPSTTTIIQQPVSTEKVEEDDVKEAEIVEQEAETMSKLSSEEIKQILDSVCQEMLGGFEADFAQKLRDRETSFLSKINKIHKVAET